MRALRLLRSRNTGRLVGSLSQRSQRKKKGSKVILTWWFLRKSQTWRSGTSSVACCAEPGWPSTGKTRQSILGCVWKTQCKKSRKGHRQINSKTTNESFCKRNWNLNLQEAVWVGMGVALSSIPLNRKALVATKKSSFAKSKENQYLKGKKCYM